jgi:acetyl-CoA hydrolase
LYFILGVGIGIEVNDLWGNLMKKRYPYINGKTVVNKINKGEIEMNDIHLSHFAQDIGNTLKIDLGIIEVSEIHDEIILTGAGITFIKKLELAQK